jgi:NADPH:quinone reductase-like Zn-dependent oxidoreductase
LGTTLRPRIDSIYPLREAQEAHRRMETGAQMGKILIDCMTE